MTENRLINAVDHRVLSQIISNRLESLQFQMKICE